MPPTVTIGLLVLGGVLILVAILGGNFKIFGVELANSISNPYLRFVAFVFGAALVVIVILSDGILTSTPAPTPTPAEQFRLSRIHITGFIDMNDDENFGSDENKNVLVDTYVNVSSDSNATYEWEDCVGDEVQGYLNVQMQLDKETGIVSGQGSSRYYEGTTCGETDRQGYDSFDFRIAPGQAYPYQIDLSDSDGGVSYNLNFMNKHVE